MMLASSSLRAALLIFVLILILIFVLILLRWLALRRGLPRLLRLIPRSLRYVYLLTVFQRIRGVHDHLVRGRDAAKNFERGAIIASNADPAELHLAARTYHRYLRAFTAKQHCIHRNRNLIYIGAYGEVHFAERSGQQAAILVGDVDLR